jgi:hypothetical protein
LNFLKSIIKKILNSFGFDIVRKQSLVDFYLHKYDSYEQYKRVQIFHNKRKINNIWADEFTLNRVSNLVLHGSKESLINGLCHGARNGFEQNFINSIDKRFRVIGTDISDNATFFENSVQWDFHDINPEWIGKFDFIYTNSLDQSWKPKEALEIWLDQLKEAGMLIIELTKSHGPQGAGEMDPFGVRPEVFPYVLTMWFGRKISIEHSVSKKKNMNIDAWLFVITKNQPPYKFSGN